MFKTDFSSNLWKSAGSVTPIQGYISHACLGAHTHREFLILGTQDDEF